MVRSSRAIEGTIQGGQEKNGMGYFPQYVDAITGISVCSDFWEKLY